MALWPATLNLRSDGWVEWGIHMDCQQMDCATFASLYVWSYGEENASIVETGHWKDQI